MKVFIPQQKMGPHNKPLKMEGKLWLSNYSCWLLNQPIWKNIMLVKIGTFPQFFGVKTKKKVKPTTYRVIIPSYIFL